MPVKPVRRLSPPPTVSLYDEVSRAALSCGWSAQEAAATEREHPGLIVRRGDDVLAALPGGGLAYAFESERTFVANFEPMFEELLPRMRHTLANDDVRFRLTHNPARPIVEPVLRKLWFTPARSWFLFSLAKKTPLPKLATPPGVRYRDGGVEDLDDLIRLDREAFPDTPVPRSALRARLESGERVLLATKGAEVVGAAIYLRADEDAGYLRDLAVATAHRGAGVGAALTARVAKKLFAEGAERLDLRTEDGNADAIRLYVRLGFKQVHAGRDYTRPIDPRAIAQLKKRSEGTMIRFGGWR
jgi:ribosomal protein S18 acetylase RimI-like enzyme